MYLSFFFGCNAMLPTETAKPVPPDHTDIRFTAAHKPGGRHPYSFDKVSGTYLCASPLCHHLDLKGGIGYYNGKNVITPSCYQCHGTRWEAIDSSYVKF